MKANTMKTAQQPQGVWKMSMWLDSNVRTLVAALALAALMPWLSACAELPRKPPTQIVYRFDDHRYLTLTGFGCEGALNYVDEKRGINTSMMDQFARVFLPPIIHADDDGDYIFIPYYEPSAFMVSKDHGRTFQDARWIGDGLYADQIKKITVVHQQAFIETKDGRLFMTSKPFGQGWGMGVIDLKYLPQTTLAERPQFKNMPTQIPPVTNYKGWTEMHCNPDLQGKPAPAFESFFNSLRKKEPDELQ
jgi:hypothetical protein